MIPGTQGYAEQAPHLIEQYESLAFADKHRAVLHLLPDKTSQVLDVGAGTGADAAWLAARGHRVIAVEPTAERHGPVPPGRFTLAGPGRRIRSRWPRLGGFAACTT